MAVKASYRGVIFDLDGVLCHTDQYHYLAWKAMADRLGIEFNHQLNDRLRGVSRMQSLEIILNHSSHIYTNHQKIKLAEEKNKLYVQYLQQMTTADIAPETVKTLISLREMGVALAIGSSSKNTPLILERLGLRSYFDAIADGNDVTCSKPAPDVFLLAAQRLGLLPQQCLVIEDAEAGLQAATAGGFDCAGIGVAAGCADITYAIDSLQELLSLNFKEGRYIQDSFEQS